MAPAAIRSMTCETAKQQIFHANLLGDILASESLSLTCLLRVQLQSIRSGPEVLIHSARIAVKTLGTLVWNSAQCSAMALREPAQEASSTSPMPMRHLRLSNGSSTETPGLGHPSPCGDPGLAPQGFDFASGAPYKIRALTEKAKRSTTEHSRTMRMPIT